MIVEVSKKPSSISAIKCDTLILGLFEGMPTPFKETENTDKSLTSFITQVVRDLPDCAKMGETTVIHTYDLLNAKRVILVGMGKRENLTIDKIRQASAISARTAQKLNSRNLATLIYEAGDGFEAAKLVKAIVEGSILGTYRFEYYKTKQDDQNKIEKLERLIVFTCGEKQEQLIQAACEGKIVAESVNLARDLTNHPAHYITPDKMAAAADEIAVKHGLGITVFGREEMKERQMNALLAVAQGSSEAPKLIVLKYDGHPFSQERMAFVGKGITFDSGGISLKPSDGMDKMIRDMAGAATVLGAVAAIAALKFPVNILGVLPCTENMPSGSAYRPGDIITSMSGKTIEVVNTDAEGRLILADAITYAKKAGATRLVDVATLTGACVTALGTTTSAAISNDQNWCGQVMRAAKEAGEKMWELPNDEEYLKLIKSQVADLKNSGGRPAGTITAGLFLGQFAEKTPWVHLDIAGTGDIKKTEGYNYRGATGVGVRTLIELAKDFAGNKES